MFFSINVKFKVNERDKERIKEKCHPEFIYFFSNCGLVDKINKMRTYSKVCTSSFYYIVMFLLFDSRQFAETGEVCNAKHLKVSYFC